MEISREIEKNPSPLGEGSAKYFEANKFGTVRLWQDTDNRLKCQKRWRECVLASFVFHVSRSFSCPSFLFVALW